ncbi:hypothetical protein Ab1vBOLIVR5_gp114c [Agrobacterium phage OLIVR5]|uniref:Uncharacterized protein n=1 Tax=Agrobacterium phage OLIVR5 TaxID=2723773 RepID=A0A858MSP2_9CAUD|nr:hypothetical protein KNU99_gp114 [Agrobacterium phage OLIVR5]QIW87762.1 hypothetical protein Ab1vBOLIVR5_gp114c [Agrobacterium phage OLIVR5]QIW88024.1 hypothetical protein Ab1vBOLIVR6_gp117c [Agrobacterium phage OLIVR6]
MVLAETVVHLASLAAEVKVEPGEKAETAMEVVLLNNLQVMVEQQDFRSGQILHMFTPDRELYSVPDTQLKGEEYASTYCRTFDAFSNRQRIQERSKTCPIIEFLWSESFSTNVRPNQMV